MEDFKKQLKAKLDCKIDKEFEDLLVELRNCKPQVILERAYEKVSKEEMIYKIKDKDYSINELKALLKTDNILQECYDEWLESDGGFNQILEESIDNRIETIVEDYNKESKTKIRENR
jgi:hypothetical protein